jgi:outer membrane protein assembly factor BamE (lipoprotein component of BamABCDE complex)
MIRFSRGGLVAKFGLRPLVMVLSLAAAAAVLPGCSTTTGTKVEAADLSFIAKGKTTKSQLVTRLGEPTMRTSDSSGGEIYLWSFAKTDIDAKTFIPFAGVLLGGSKTAYQELQVKLDKKGIVSDYKFSDGLAKSKSGV